MTFTGSAGAGFVAEKLKVLPEVVISNEPFPELPLCIIASKRRVG